MFNPSRKDDVLYLVDHAYCYIEHVDPTIAATFLERNEDNRSIRKNKVKTLSRHMKNNLWRFTGEAIRFDRDGKLIDGQHRLLAVIDSNTPQWFLIIKNLENQAQFAIDRGTVRQLADDLHFGHNVKNAAMVAAIVRLDWCRRNIKGNYINNRAAYIQSPEEWVKVYLANKDIFDSAATFATNDYLKKIMTPSIVGMFFIAFKEIDEDWAKWFWSVLKDETQSKDSDPVVHLKRRLVESAISKRKLDAVTQVALTTKAWNLSREGKEIKQLLYRPTGPTPEEFPVVN